MKPVASHMLAWTQFAVRQAGSALNSLRVVGDNILRLNTIVFDGAAAISQISRALAVGRRLPMGSVSPDMNSKKETSVYINGKWRCATAQGFSSHDGKAELASVVLYFSGEDVRDRLTDKQRADMLKELFPAPKQR
jgi:hypothetical protein